MDLHHPLAPWMPEPEAVCVQRQARRRRASIASVPKNGDSLFCKVSADLMSPACLQADLQQAAIVLAGEETNVRLRRAGSGILAAAGDASLDRERTTDDLLSLLWGSRHHGQVPPAQPVT